MGYCKRLSLIVLAFGLSVQSALAACLADQVHLRGAWGQAAFTVELAVTPEERSRGLMYRDSMAQMAGMLFVYDKPRPLTFWMKNTFIPLDILFADSRGVVVRVHENARPQDLTQIPSGADAQFVLEINGGMAAKLGLSVGSEIRHPMVDQNFAAWSCN